jgi:hypothetical protein
MSRPLDLHELNYASDHPFAYGPANVIALGAAAGAALSLSVEALALAALRNRDSPASVGTRRSGPDPSVESRTEPGAVAHASAAM